MVPRAVGRTPAAYRTFSQTFSWATRWGHFHHTSIIKIVLAIFQYHMVGMEEYGVGIRTLLPCSCCSGDQCYLLASKLNNGTPNWLPCIVTFLHTTLINILFLELSKLRLFVIDGFFLLSGLKDWRFRLQFSEICCCVGNDGSYDWNWKKCQTITFVYFCLYSK